jgi:hypothetical protein
MDKDGAGTISLDEYEVDSAIILAQLCDFVRESFDNYNDMSVGLFATDLQLSDKNNGWNKVNKLKERYGGFGPGVGIQESWKNLTGILREFHGKCMYFL